MKLLFKHLTRSIGKKPLQPIILTLTIALAVVASIFAFTLADTLREESSVAQTVKYGSADLTVSVGNSSNSRFLFTEDVEDVLGEDANVAGTYELPMIVGNSERTVICMATEFERVGKIFDVEFVEYGKVTEGSIPDVAFISEDFANDFNLSVGDSLEVETMGQKRCYQIQGVAKIPFLATYDVMVDISSVVRVFANNSLLFAAIGDDFKPCGKIYVDISECKETNFDDAIRLLSSDPRFEEKNFTDVRSLELRKNRTHSLDIVIDFAVAFAALLSAVVTFCCFYILSNERIEENLILVYSGARPRALLMMQYFETVIYWLLGAPLGIVGAIPLSLLISRFVGLKYVDVTVKTATAIKSALIILAICVLTVTFFIFSSKLLKKTGKRHTLLGWRPALCLLFFITILFGLMHSLAPDIRFYLFILTTMVLVTLIFVAIPPICKCFAIIVERSARGTVKPSAIAFRYAMKNACSLKLFHNISRLFAVVVTIVITVGLLFLCLQGQISVIENAFDADYAVLNATDSCYQKTLSCDSAETVSKFHLTQSSLTTIISSEDISVYSESLNINRFPIKNEAIVSVGISHMLNVKIGDEFKIEVDGMMYDLVLIDVGKSPINYVAINCEDLGIPYNMLLVKGREGISSTELLGELSECTASELAAIVAMDSLVQNLTGLLETYISSGEILLIIFAIFSLIGTVDTLYESSRSRREEFGLYCLAGMSKRTLRLMKTLEIIIATAFGIIIGLVASIAMAFAFNAGLAAKSIELFLGIKESIK